MPYIGNQTSAAFTSMAKQDLTGNGGASYTLTHAVANEQEIEVYVNNVRQEPGVAYTVSGTALTMTGNVASTDDFYVVYQGKAIQTSVPGDGTVTTAMLQDDAATAAKVDSTLHLSTIKDSAGTNNAITIDSSGNLTVAENLTLTTQPRLYVQGNDNSYISTSPIPFGNNVIDTAGGWSTSTNTYTVQVAGTYMVMVDLGIVLTNGSQATGYAQIVHNNNNSGYTYIQSSTGAQYHGQSVNKMFVCSVNDTFKITWGGSGTYYNGANECRLSIFMLG